VCEHPPAVGRGRRRPPDSRWRPAALGVLVATAVLLALVVVGQSSVVTLIATAALGAVLIGLLALLARVLLAGGQTLASRTPALAFAGQAPWRMGAQEAARAAEGIIGEPVQAICPFLLGLQQTTTENWSGEEPLWIVLSVTELWVVRCAPDGTVAGVKSRLPRQGLSARIDQRSPAGQGADISWPALPWYMQGELRGNTARMAGLLTADWLGVRALLDQPKAARPFMRLPSAALRRREAKAEAAPRDSPWRQWGSRRSLARQALVLESQDR
jgi:hypothetical protein